MSLGKTFSVMRKEIRHILRDRTSFLLVTLSPVFLLLTMGLAFSIDIKNVAVAILDQDQSPLSRKYLARLSSTEALNISYRAENYDQIERWLKRNQIKAAVIIPPGFNNDLKAGHTAPLQIIIDGTDPNTADHAIRHIALRTENFAFQLAADRLGRQGPSQDPTPPIDLRLRTWYNPSLKFTVGIIPALVAVVMAMPATAASLTVAREKEWGTLEGLIATPIRRSELLIGKLIPYILAGLLSVILCVAAAVYIFDVPFRGNLLLYLLLSVDFLFASLGIALLISVFASSQQVAIMASMLLFLFSGFFLSGVFMPLSTMGPLMKMEAHMMPTTLFVIISRGIFVKGLGLVELWAYAAGLLAMGLIFISLTILLFRKKLK